MLTCAMGIIFIATAVTALVPQDLFVISMIKQNVVEIRDGLDDYRNNITAEINAREKTLREIPPESQMQQNCLERQLYSARMEIMKLLNMLVTGEKNELKTVEAALINLPLPMTTETALPELNKLWGSIAAHSEARKTMQTEMIKYRKSAINRLDQIKRMCNYE